MECLITRLKATVDDPSLEVLGELRFSKLNVTATLDTTFVRIDTESDMTVRLISGTFYQGGSLTPTTEREKFFAAGSQASFWCSPGSVVSVRPKYGITNFTANSANIDFSNFKNVSGLTQLYLASCTSTGSIENLKGTKLTYLHIRESSATGNLGELDLSALTTLNITRTALTGDIATCFGRSTRLGVLNIADSGISGSVENLIAARRVAGQTTGTVKIPYAGATRAVTYNGSALPSLVSGELTAVFTWNASGISFTTE